MDPKQIHQQQQQQNRNAAAAYAGPTSTSQAMHHGLSDGALSLREPQPQQAVMLDGSRYSVSVVAERRWRQLGIEQRDAPDVGGGANAGPPAKRKGRPLGSRDKQPRKASGGGGGGGGGGPLTAHVIDVNAGEDIAIKLVEFMNQEPREVCILSASGVVSIAVLQSDNPLGFVKYEGLYVITDLSGTFWNTESDDGATVTRTGNLRVTLAGPDCKVVWGCVGGMLVAGSQVQVIVGTFTREGVKLSAASAPANALSLTGGSGPGLPQSQGPSESLEENASKSLGNSTPQPPHHLPLWPGNNPQ
ncbi:hypothetical protein DY000_02045825 [Brassica cretica]|uniref:AT-hook motif nuclear-localized protein n=1 Tax=Brassica cretica TaxID=69181 RepID=A0ABQ7F756_BRACR|nr:hypothetical protein DY000_02045825 [Brassica cretica]